MEHCFCFYSVYFSSRYTNIYTKNIKSSSKYANLDTFFPIYLPKTKFIIDLKQQIRTFTTTFFSRCALLFCLCCREPHDFSQANPYYFPHLSIIYCSRFLFMHKLYISHVYIPAFIFHFLLFWVKQRTSPEFKTFFFIVGKKKYICYPEKKKKRRGKRNLKTVSWSRIFQVI